MPVTRGVNKFFTPGYFVIPQNTLSSFLFTETILNRIRCYRDYTHFRLLIFKAF